MNEEYREAGYIEAMPVEYPPAEYLDIVYLTDGRTIIGKIVEETAETITILTTEGERITINRENIINIGKSVVPPVQEYVDIIYLKDGSIVVGKIIGETAETITIRIDSEEITISREDIQNVRKSVFVPIGAIEPWLKKYGPWMLAGAALVFSAIALSKK